MFCVGRDPNEFLSVSIRLVFDPHTMSFMEL